MNAKKDKVNLSQIPLSPYAKQLDPPFGLYDIFNFLICHSTAYDKQGLAAYKSFDDYRLFEGGYVESLLTKILTNERLHLYVGKVRPAMKTTTDDGKKCYDLWFILQGIPKRNVLYQSFQKLYSF